VPSAARDRIEPRPVLHVAGRADALVSFAAQIRVFLDTEVKIREGLRSPEAGRIIQQGLAGKVPLVPECEIINPMSAWKFQLTVIFGICILGFLAGLTEVVKERAIVERETACGVRPSADIASKLALLAVVLPLLLLPQLLLGGLLIRLDGGLLAGIAEIGVPTFWAFRGSIEYVVFQPPVPAFDLGSPISLGKAATALGLQLVAAWALAFAALAFSLRRKAAEQRAAAARQVG
jgi:hypothetical protein